MSKQPYFYESMPADPVFEDNYFQKQVSQAFEESSSIIVLGDPQAEVSHDPKGKRPLQDDENREDQSRIKRLCVENPISGQFESCLGDVSDCQNQTNIFTCKENHDDTMAINDGALDLEKVKINRGYGDGTSRTTRMDDPQDSIHALLARCPPETKKCAPCRRDHKKA
jgi:hypothetical protein